VVAAVALIVGNGCEDGSETRSLTVHPARVSLAEGDYYQEFIASGPTSMATNTVSATTPENVSANAGPTGGEPQETYQGSGRGLSELALPLEWSVSDPSLGSIREASGDRAVYARTGKKGMQIVRVKDQYGAEGFAVVNQK